MGCGGSGTATGAVTTCTDTVLDVCFGPISGLDADACCDEDDDGSGGTGSGSWEMCFTTAGRGEGVGMEPGGVFIGVDLDFSGLRDCPATERRLANWKRYNAGETLEPDIVTAERFEAWIAHGLEEGTIVAIGPGMVKKAGNLLAAVKKDRATGKRRVSAEVRTERLTICRECPAKLYNKAKGTCLHPKCGCVMTRKTRWSSTECPVGYWGEDFSNGGSDE
jgi:hypothetical protein